MKNFLYNVILFACKLIVAIAVVIALMYAAFTFFPNMGGSPPIVGVEAAAIVEEATPLERAEAEEAGQELVAVVFVTLDDKPMGMLFVDVAGDTYFIPPEDADENIWGLAATLVEEGRFVSITLESAGVSA